MSQLHEFYRYAVPGERLARYHHGSHQQQVRYLPGLEVRTGEQQHLLMIKAGNSHIYLDGSQRISHFNLADRLGSLSGVVDEQATLVSRETWYPFGGTASWLTGVQASAALKFRRYVGKERDATGLIYFGWRCYVPWEMRWLNCDPAGTVDGLNLFRMVRNNPLTLRDSEGLSPIALPELTYYPLLLDAIESLEHLSFGIKRTLSAATEAKLGMQLDCRYFDEVRDRVTEKLNEAALPWQKETFWTTVMEARKIVNDAENYEYGSPLNEEGGHVHLSAYLKGLPVSVAPPTTLSLQSMARDVITSQLAANAQRGFESQKDLHIAFIQNQISLFSQQATQQQPDLLEGHTPSGHPPLNITGFNDILSAHRDLNFATYDTGAFDHEQVPNEENIQDFIQVEFVRYELANKIALLTH